MPQFKNSDPLLIEVTSDFICPWCFIGEARLEQALQIIAPTIPIKISWCPYELNPDMPQKGVDRQDYLSQKFGSEKLQMMDARMKELGEEDGLEFRQELIKLSPNTRLAHRLNWLAEKTDKNVTHLIFEAYFSRGRDIGNIDVLVALASEAGMDVKMVRGFLSSGEGIDEVKAMETMARGRGIQAVPFFTIGNEEVHGAETVEEMTAALKRAIKSHKAA